mmetsp:Transcript_19973/g.39551  ORF Transcript_19973/g.39551 Transcript_19973/m.39551 type:complete len:95 (+) Transcript_19973:691-975(+)
MECRFKGQTRNYYDGPWDYWKVKGNVHCFGGILRLRMVLSFSDLKKINLCAIGPATFVLITTGRESFKDWKVVIKHTTLPRKGRPDVLFHVLAS